MPRAKRIARLSKDRDGMMLGERREECQNRWADPVFQRELFGYDVEDEVQRAWRAYKAQSF